MATTTNYGWVTPDDTALVKDGAAAIRTLGSSADTTTKNLNPETTLGDISFRSSTSNVNTRLGIGTAGQVLTVVGGLPAYATPAAGALTKITSAAFTTQSTVAVDDCFTATYTKYLVIYNMICSVNLAEGQLQFRYAGPNTQTATYFGAGFSQNRGNTVANFGFDNVAAAIIVPDLGTTQTSFGQITFNNVGNSSQLANFYATGHQADGQSLLISTGLQNTARIYTGFLLSASSGTITGSYAVYGLEN